MRAEDNKSVISNRFSFFISYEVNSIQREKKMYYAEREVRKVKSDMPLLSL